jgi:cytosine/adenosine deaminase-related metal-dependent hydrolase
VGVIAPGMAADFCTLDLSAPALEGWDEASLLSAFVFGADAAVVGEVCVAGRWRPAREPGPGSTSQ